MVREKKCFALVEGDTVVHAGLENVHHHTRKGLVKVSIVRKSTLKRLFPTKIEKDDNTKVNLRTKERELAHKKNEIFAARALLQEGGRCRVSGCISKCTGWCVSGRWCISEGEGVGTLVGVVFGWSFLHGPIYVHVQREHGHLCVGGGT